MSLGKKLSNYRKSAGLTQQQLGEKLNLSPQAISKWENDLAEPDLSTLKALSELYKVSIGEMLDVDDGAYSSTEDEKEAEPTEETTSIIGFCKKCGITVTEDTVGEKHPVILCKKCRDQRNEDARRAKEAAVAKEKIRLCEVRNSHVKKIWVSLIVAGIVAFAVLSLSLGSVFNSGNYGGILTALIFTYAVFSFVACMFYDCFVKEIFLDWSMKSFQWPGLIFTFDLDGIIWLIGMKLLFWALGLVLGLLCALIGLLIGLICAPFLFPFIMVSMKRAITNGEESKYYE